jgi:hypothetical protein
MPAEIGNIATELEKPIAAKTSMLLSRLKKYMSANDKSMPEAKATHEANIMVNRCLVTDPVMNLLCIFKLNEKR